MKNSIFSSAFDSLENSVSHASLEGWDKGPVAANQEHESSSIVVVSLLLLERSIHHKSSACMTFCRTGYIILAPAVVQYLAI